MLKLESKKLLQILLQTYARIFCQTAVVVNVWMGIFIKLILYGVHLRLKLNLDYTNYHQWNVFCAIVFVITQT